MTDKPITAQSVNDRVDEMLKWAKGVEKRQAALTHKLLDGAESEGDRLALELGDLYAQYQDVPDLRQAAESKRLELRYKLNESSEALADIEAELFLNISAEMTPEGKLRYSKTGPDGKAALRLALKDRAEYQALKGKRKKVEREDLSLKALIASLDEKTKEYSRRRRTMEARLNHFTAKISR